MPDRRAFDRWYALGRFLPRDVRERVFEPALSDLARAWLLSPAGERRAPFGVLALGTYLGCLPGTTVRLFVREGRLTRLGRASVWTLGILATAVVVLRSISEGYAAGGP